MPSSSDDSRTPGHLDFVRYFSGGDDAVKPRAFVAGSDIVGEMTSSATASIVAATSAWPTAAGSSTTVIESLDGAVRDHSVGGYVNYLERDTPPARYFGENLPRLDAVRRRYDPVASMYHPT